MRLFFGTIFLCFFASIILGQTSDKKALEALDTLKDEAKWKVSIHEFYDRSLRHRDSSLLASVMFSMGKHYLGQGKLDSVKSISERAISFYGQNKINGPENFFNMKAICFSHKNKTDSAIHYFLEAAAIFESKKNKVKAAYIKNNIANLFLTMKDFRQAEKYFTEIMGVLETVKDSTYLPGIYASLSAVKQANGEFQSAKTFAEKSLKMALARKDILGQLLAYRQNGLLQSAEGKSSEAINSFEKAMEIAIMTRQVYYQSLIQMNKAEAYFEAKDFRKAEKEARSSLQYVSYPGFQSHLPRLYTILSGSLYANNSFKEAYEYLSKAELMRDSISNFENKTILSDLNLKYETEKKDKQITSQQLDLVNQQSKSKSLAIALLAILGLVIIISVLAFFNSKLQKSRIVNIQNVREKEVLNAIIAGEEQERKRLAEEIHDGLNNALFSAKLSLSSISSEEDAVRQKINQSIGQIDLLREESRRVAHNLWPAQMESEGLITLCKQYFESGLKTPEGTKIYFQDFGSEFTRLPVHTEMLIYRMVQELTGNALRHSDGNEIDVQIFNDTSEVRVQVEDNGKGMNTEELQQKGHGLTSIEQRLALINGSLYLHSEPGKGTIAEIKIVKCIN